MILSSEIPRSSPRHEHAALLGYAAQLLMAGPRKEFRIRSLAPWVLTPIHLGQIEFAFNLKNQPVAYATWAFLSDDVRREMAQDPDRLLHVSEWNEGTHVWLVDVVAPYGNSYPFLRELLRRRLHWAGRVQGARRHADGTLRHLVDVTYATRDAA